MMLMRVGGTPGGDASPAPAAGGDETAIAKPSVARMTTGTRLRRGLVHRCRALRRRFISPPTPLVTTPVKTLDVCPTAGQTTLRNGWGHLREMDWRSGNGPLHGTPSSCRGGNE